MARGYRGKQNRSWMAGAAKADSKWEGRLRDTILTETDYHPEKVEYVVHHKYEPDFKCGNILIEAKGRFRESSEASKYKWVRDCLPEEMELVFLFQDPYKPMPHAKKRANGTKQTHAEWAERNKFRWFNEITIQEILTDKEVAVDESTSKEDEVL